METKTQINWDKFNESLQERMEGFAQLGATDDIHGNYLYAAVYIALNEIHLCLQKAKEEA